ncbi:MAG TPA: hypothetical protein VF681_06185 [Abditibacteriaceae bacterium]|jgi:hypothetical protein
MGLQDALRKAAGLLVELPPQEPEPLDMASDEATEEVDINALLAEKGLGPNARGANANVAPPRTVEQIVREADGPNLDEIKLDTPPPDDKTVEPAAVYAAAKLPSTPFSAEQMLEMLASLPPELPLDTRRQTVKVTFSAIGKTVGATPESVVADASRKMAALAAYGDYLKKRTDTFANEGEAEIAQLQQQIEAKRAAILEARQKHQAATQMCQAESDRLDDVLEFFSLDVAPSKYAEPEAK